MAADSGQDREIFTRITTMVEDERRLREDPGAGRIDDATEHQRLGELESALDQCWDLLRRRRDKSGFWENPDDARVRSASQVEG